MKRIVIIIAILIGCVSLTYAQDPIFRESLNGIKKIELKASTKMTVVTGTANEISFAWGTHCNGCKDSREDQYDYNHYEEWDGDDYRDEKRKERAKGLTAIYSEGVDNTGIGMYMERDGDVLRIKDLKPITQRKAFTITIPKDMNLHLDTSTLGSAYIQGLNSEVEIDSNVGSVQLVDVTGPITANSSTGSIDVIFKTVNQNAPISITSATGDIDVSIPSSTKADVELRSTMGKVYSNFDLVKPREDGLKNVSGNRKIKGQLNNGGVKVYLSSSTGNIYLRKQ